MRVVKEQKFTPVNIVLETQAEVDGIYALLNHSSISRAVGFGADLQELLADCNNEAQCRMLHENLCAIKSPKN